MVVIAEAMNCQEVQGQSTIAFCFRTYCGSKGRRLRMGSWIDSTLAAISDEWSRNPKFPNEDNYFALKRHHVV